MTDGSKEAEEIMAAVDAEAARRRLVMNEHKELAGRLREMVRDIRENGRMDYIGPKATTTMPEIEAALGKAADTLERLSPPEGVGLTLETTSIERAARLKLIEGLPDRGFERRAIRDVNTLVANFVEEHR